MRLFRKIELPSPWRFITAVMFWFAIPPLLLSVWVFIHVRGNMAEVSQVFHDLWESAVLVCSVFALSACLFGVIHYLICRWLGKRSGQPFRYREAGAVVLAVMAIAVVPGIILKRAFEIGSHLKACWQTGLDQELESLVARGDVQGAVRKMEQACLKFEDAREKLGPEFEKRWKGGYGHNGNGYFFCTLHYGWETLDRNMPRTLCWYFDMGPRDSSTGNFPLQNPEQWAALGKELSKSNTPILRVLGFHLLGDRENFVQEVYRQRDSGDRNFAALYLWVTYSMDPDPERALLRTRKLKDEGFPGRESNPWIIDVFDNRVFHLAFELLHNGKAPADQLDFFRETARRYRSTPSFRYREYYRWQQVRPDLPGKLNSLMNSGDAANAVKLMEDACANYREARIRLGPEFAAFTQRLDDNDEYFTGLSHVTGTLDLNLPKSLIWYLNCTVPPNDSSSSALRANPEQRLKLGEEMSTSETPILRTLGLWLKGDLGGFVNETYRQLDAGDLSFQALATSVAFRNDTSPHRALHRLQQLKAGLPEGKLKDWIAMEHDQRVFNLACELLRDGQDLGEHLDDAREATKRHVLTEQFMHHFWHPDLRLKIEVPLQKMGVTPPELKPIGQ
jgi:hypothetical protein